MAYGVILGQKGGSGGKRYARIVIATSTAGYTASDCDYLCDGTADDVEINAAIQALPSTGGEIIILDGTYNITSSIVLKSNIIIAGNGSATVLMREWNSSASTYLNTGVINIPSITNCSITNLQINGNKSSYTAAHNVGISGYNSSFILIKNVISNNNEYHGINLNECSSCSVYNCNCNENNGSGIFIYSGADTLVTNNINVIGNLCNTNSSYGIHLEDLSYGTCSENICNSNTKLGIHCINMSNVNIIGNNCNYNGDGMYLGENSINNTISGNNCNYNIGSGANNTGVQITSSPYNTISNNCCNYNAYGIIVQNNSDFSTIVGNLTYNNTTTGIRLGGNTGCNITGNVCTCGTGQSSDYTSNQYGIYLSTTNNNNNLITCNNLMGKNYGSAGGSNNIFANNHY